MSKDIKKKANEKRRNLTKDEVASVMKHKDTVEKLKTLVRAVFPILETMDSVYDAQTVANGFSGLIQSEVEKKVLAIKLSDLVFNLDQEPEGKVKEAIKEIIAQFPDESAQYLAESLEKLGSTFTRFIADKYLKEPMSTIKINDLVAK